MKEYTKRRFLEKYRWQLWSAQDLEQIYDQTPRFWDDGTITPPEWNQIRWFGGVEVHDLSLVLALYGYWRDQIYLGPITQYDTTNQGYEKIVEDLTPFSIQRFLMETSGIYHFQVYWELTKRFPTSQVIVMNASDLARYIKRTRKSDKADAVKLAQIARYDELIRRSYCPPPEIAYLRDLCRQYGHQKREMVKIKNRIKKLLAMYGFRWAFNYQTPDHVTFIKTFLQTNENMASFLPNYPFSKESMRELIGPWKGFDPPLDMRKMVYFEFCQLTIRMTELDLMETEITRLIKADPEFRKQMTLIEEIPGLGWINSVCLLLEIGDIRRFATMGRFVVYCGIGPAGGSSGAPQLGSAEEKVVQKDKPNRKCNPVLKRILTQAAMVNFKQARLGRTTNDITRYAAKFPEDKKQRLKYRFKVAAKMTRQLYHCLLNQERFSDQGDFVVQVSSKRNSHNERIRRKIRRLEQRQGELKQAWTQIFDQLMAMGIDTQSLEHLQEACFMKEESS
jgi:transposase